MVMVVVAAALVVVVVISFKTVLHLYTGWMKVIWEVSNNHLTTVKLHTEIQLIPLEGKLQKLSAVCGVSDITTTMATEVQMSTWQ